MIDNPYCSASLQPLNGGWLREQGALPTRPHRFSHRRARRTWQALLLGGTVLLIGTSCSAASEQALPDVADSTTEDFGLVWQQEVYDVPGYAELAATADIVVEAEVADLQRGPAVGDPGSQIGFLDVTLEVSDWLKGGNDSKTVRVLVQGYDPQTGQDVIVEGSADLEVGQQGMWFLIDAALPDEPDAFYELTSAGRVTRSSDDRARTNGDQTPAAALCNIPWAQARQMIVEAVEQSSSVSKLEPFEETNSGDAHNECHQSVEDRAAERRASSNEGGA